MPFVVHDLRSFEAGVGKVDRLRGKDGLRLVSFNRRDDKTGGLEGGVMQKIEALPVRRPDRGLIDSISCGRKRMRFTAIRCGNPNTTFFWTVAIRDECELVTIRREDRSFIFRFTKSYLLWSAATGWDQINLVPPGFLQHHSQSLAIVRPHGMAQRPTTTTILLGRVEIFRLAF
jgi:hypothetical protein